MRHSISYNRTLNLEEFISKIEEHTKMFNAYFGDEWAYSGSCAVILYAMEYLPTELENLSTPNDIDILIKSRQPISNRRIDKYDTKIQSTLEKSVTYENSTNKNSIDVTAIPNLKKIMINGNPVLFLPTLLDYYEDELIIREKDTPKIVILRQINDIINASAAEAVRANRAEDDQSSNRFGGLSRSLF